MFAVIPVYVEIAKLGALGRVLTLPRVFLQLQMSPVWMTCPSHTSLVGRQSCKLTLLLLSIVFVMSLVVFVDNKRPCS